MSRVIKNYPNKITQTYKKGTHDGIDIVGNKDNKSAIDYIVAHTEGTVVAVEKNYNKTDKTGSSYGNYVKIKHPNGYYTLYAHLKYNTVVVNVGDNVKTGDTLGYMGNTGHSFGAHLHFEVRNTKDTKIDPTTYIDGDLPSVEPKEDLVKELQRVLNEQYNCGLDVDGSFGPLTTKASDKNYLYKGKKAPKHIKWLQTRLVAFGYDIGKYGIDSSFGNDTLTAVKKFQKDHGLFADGNVGKNTHKKLVNL